MQKQVDPHPGKEQELEGFPADTAVPLVLRQAGLVAQHVGRPRDPSSTEYVYEVLPAAILERFARPARRRG
jgi:hypothetical protein